MFLGSPNGSFKLEPYEAHPSALFRWYLLFSKDFADFIQNAVRTETISQIQPNGELPVQNVFFTRLHSANLLHCRSPFLCALSTSIIGSLSHPVETGLLIPSVLLGPSARETL